MKTHYEYKGYLGSAEVDIEGGALVGRLLFINDVIAYSADTPGGLEAEFRAAVDEYLDVCASLGDEPDTPCKGTFNVRIGPDLHRKVAVAARLAGIGLNDYVKESLAAAVREAPPPHVRVAQGTVQVRAAPGQSRSFLTINKPAEWEEPFYAAH